MSAPAIRLGYVQRTVLGRIGAGLRAVRSPSDKPVVRSLERRGLIYWCRVDRCYRCVGAGVVAQSFEVIGL